VTRDRPPSRRRRFESFPNRPSGPPIPIPENGDRPETVIQLFQATKRYRPGLTALREVSLEIRPGEFCFITGPTGAGKTTLLKLVFRLERVTDGQLVVLGMNLRRLPTKDLHRLRRRAGFVFQDFRLIPDRSVAYNVALPLIVAGGRRSFIRERVKHVLGLVGLTDYADYRPPMLSGGQQQRVAFARAVVNEPELLLADEPTGNLDPGATDRLMGLIRRQHARGSTVLVATHDLALIHRSGGRIITLKSGRLAADQGLPG
jgi:cell division transport system ATP-binding protein